MSICLKVNAFSNAFSIWNSFTYLKKNVKLPKKRKYLKNNSLLQILRNNNAESTRLVLKQNQPQLL